MKSIVLIISEKSLSGPARLNFSRAEFIFPPLFVIVAFMFVVLSKSGCVGVTVIAVISVVLAGTVTDLLAMLFVSSLSWIAPFPRCAESMTT